MHSHGRGYGPDSLASSEAVSVGAMGHAGEEGDEGLKGPMGEESLPLHEGQKMKLTPEDEGGRNPTESTGYTAGARAMLLPEISRRPIWPGSEECHTH